MNRSRIGDGFGLFLVVLSGLVLTYGLPHRMDLVATDDDVYFENGLKFIQLGVPMPVQMAPLFSGWYLLLNAFTQTIIDTQYLSWALLSVLPGVLVYWLLRSLRVGVWGSVAVAVLYLYGPLNFPLDQKVSPFTMLWLLGGLIAANYQQDPTRKLTAAAAGALAATYARPEFFLSFLLLGGLALGRYVWLRRKTNVPVPYPLLGLLGVAGTLVLLFGSPLVGGRSIIAFAQHFAMNYATWHPEMNLSPWMHTKAFMVHGFGREVTSIGDAFALNPSLVIRHIFANVGTLATLTVRYALGTLVTPWLSLLAFPGRRYVLLAVAIAVLALTDWPQTLRNLRDGLRRDGWYWLCLLLVLAPTFISCLLLFPRDHYVAFHTLLYVSVAGTLLRAFALRPLSRFAPAVGYALGMLGLLGFLWPHWQTAHVPQPTPTANLIRTLETIPAQKAMTMTGNKSLMYRLYLGQHWRYLYLDQYRPADFQAFVRQNGINCFHIRPDVVAQYGKDPFFAALIANPAAAGFAKYPIDVPNQYVLVQQQPAVSIANLPSVR
jgi:hypothetical protein